MSASCSIDVDEHFEKPIPHRFMHGYLDDDPNTSFILLLPDSEFWKGRLFQFLEGGFGGNEFIGRIDLGYHVISRYGAAYIKSNHGHVAGDLSKIGYEGLEKVAHLSNCKTLVCAKRTIRKEYGENPYHTYVFGISGGGLRTTILMEKYPQLYDGALAIVQAELSIITYYCSLSREAFPILKSGREEIDNLSDSDISDDHREEKRRDALLKLYRAGFPRGAEPQLHNPRFYGAANSISVLIQDLLSLSPERFYYSDFWRKKGYAGKDGDVSDQIVEGIEGEVLETYTVGDMFSLSAPEIDTKAIQPLTVGPNLSDRNIPPWPPELLKKKVGFKGTGKYDPGELSGYTITFKSGHLKGKSFHISSSTGDIIQISGVAKGYPEDIHPGDKYVLDNRNLLAFGQYYLHIATLVEDTYRPFDLPIDKKPALPPRPKKTKDILKMKHFQTGDFKGKMISIFGAQDMFVWPPILFNYLEKIRKWKGDNLDSYYRCYLVENATHGPPINEQESFEFVSFSPTVGRALDYLVDWVEKDLAPPPSTQAKLSPEYALVLPKKAAMRKGIQPLISKMTVNGHSDVARVPIGKTVKFHGVSEAAVGKIVKYEWYCRELEDFFQEVELEEPKAEVVAFRTYTFRDPGTYRVVLRVTGDLGGDTGVLGGGQRNLAKISVVVER